MALRLRGYRAYAVLHGVVVDPEHAVSCIKREPLPTLDAVGECFANSALRCHLHILVFHQIPLGWVCHECKE